MRTLAVISDIHGNRWALEAVLKDMRSLGITEIVNLGDVLYGPLDPSGTAEILMELNIPTVRGNEDRIILQGPSGASGTLGHVRAELNESQLQWIESFSESISLNGILAFHGSPRGDTEYLLWKTEGGALVPRVTGEILSSLSGLDATLFLCGHDHVQRTVALGGEMVLVNPGSVGLPAYEDDMPVPHSMASATPHARYSVIKRVTGGYSVLERTVEYDWEAAAWCALRNGRPDWADWIRTGRTGK